jgi:hypothetical protein
MRVLTGGTYLDQNEAPSDIRYDTSGPLGSALELLDCGLKVLVLAGEARDLVTESRSCRSAGLERQASKVSACANSAAHNAKRQGAWLVYTAL